MSRSLRKSFVIYTFSNLLSSALPVLLLPFLTHLLTKSDYGVLSNFTGFVAIMMPLVVVNFTSAYSRQYFKKEIDIKAYVGTGITVQFILAIFTSLSFFIFEGFIKDKTGIDLIYIRLSGLYCFIFGVSEIILTKWRLEEKAWHFGIFRVLRTLIEVVLTFFFIMVMRMDYEGRVIGIILAVILGGIPVFLILFQKGYLRFSLRRDYVKHILRFGAPLIPHTIGGTILVYSDKLIITNEISIEANGIYSVAFQVALVIGLIQNSFNQAWVPWFFKSLTNPIKEIKKKIVKITYLYFIGLSILTFLLIVGTPFIFMILGKEFIAGSELVSWIAVGFLFNGMYKMLVNYLFYEEKTVIIGSITLLAAILNIILNIILIKLYAIKGAAIATAITFLAQFVVVWIFSQRIYPMPWFNYRKK